MKLPVDMDKKRDVAKRLKQIRSELTMSQKDFAESINITRSHYNKMESENIEMMPSKVTLKKICEKYNINFDWLYDGIGRKQAAILSEEVREFIESNNRLMKQSTEYFQMKAAEMFDDNNDDEMPNHFMFYNAATELVMEICAKIKKSKNSNGLSGNEIVEYCKRFELILKKNK